MARRPLTGFLVIVLGLSWLPLSYRFLPSMASFPVPICRWRFSRWPRRCSSLSLRQRGLLYVYKRHFGVFRFRQRRRPDDGRPDMNHHPRFNILESSLAAGVKTEVQILLDVLVMVSPETADRKGGHPD
jgi:hypothetical protein